MDMISAIRGSIAVTHISNCIESGAGYVDKEIEVLRWEETSVEGNVKFLYKDKATGLLGFAVCSFEIEVYPGDSVDVSCNFNWPSSQDYTEEVLLDMYEKFDIVNVTTTENI
jgi:hypothetical protein